MGNSPERETRYVTTPIYYVNDKPHIGHAYTSTVCDAYARFMRFSGHDVFFLTGTDEHGIKVEKSAAARGISPQQLADENAAAFESVMRKLALTHDDFIRTTQPRHERQVKEMVRRLSAADAVYLGEFEGWYDEGQEEYVPENKAKDSDYKSVISGKPLIRATEKNYYFRLSAFQEPLERLFDEQPGFVRPGARRNEILARIRDGLQDVPMSRTNFSWGVGMPDHPEHVIYVWIDALMNYVSALGLMDPEGPEQPERARFWPATYHVVGKEILWFHAVIWPAVLMALELPLPGCIYAHSFWIREGKKMSKTLGNFVDLDTIDAYVEKYGLDTWRYYMLTQGPLGATDADFSDAHFHGIYTTDLANTLGNSASRTTAMISKYFDGAVPPEGEHPIEAAGIDLRQASREALATARKAFEDLRLGDALEAGMGLVRQVDAFIHASEPFKLAKEEGKRGELGTILYRCAESLRIASLVLWCALPQKVEELWDALGVKIDPLAGELEREGEWGRLPAGGMVRKVALFPRLDA